MWFLAKGHGVCEGGQGEQGAAKAKYEFEFEWHRYFVVDW